MARLYVIGVSHVAPESIQKVRETIKKVQPDCVAVELDFGRYLAMRQKLAGRKVKIKLPPGQRFILVLFQALQEKLAKATGVIAGEEMILAIQYGRDAGAKIAFIDQDVRLTVARMFQQMKAFERLRLVGNLFIGIIGLPFIGLPGFDINKIPPEKLIKQAMVEMRKKFPSIYRALVTERDRQMAANLKILKERFERIVVVIGAGHIEGIKRQLELR